MSKTLELKIETLRKKIIDSAKNNELPIFEDYAGDTMVHCTLLDENNDKITSRQYNLENYAEDSWNYDLDEEGRFTVKQQLEIIENIFKRFDFPPYKDKNTGELVDGSLKNYIEEKLVKAPLGTIRVEIIGEEHNLIWEE